MNVLELDGGDGCITYEHAKNHWNVGFKKVNFMVWIIAIKKNTGFVVLCCKCVLVAQSCPILCDPMYCSPPGPSVHGILQAKILKWIAIPFSKGDLPDPGIESKSSVLQADSLHLSHTAILCYIWKQISVQAIEWEMIYLTYKSSSQPSMQKSWSSEMLMLLLAFLYQSEFCKYCSQ